MFLRNSLCSLLDSWDYYQSLVPLFRKEADKYYDTLVPLGVKVFRTATNFVFARLKQEHFKILKEQLPLRNIIIKFFDETKEPFFQYCIRISIGNIARERVCDSKYC
jgi:histidinol-phosphate/aromatic aminotransferase/cobyric acid decarboxylase-like protein